MKLQVTALAVPVAGLVGWGTWFCWQVMSLREWAAFTGAVAACAVVVACVGVALTRLSAADVARVAAVDAEWAEQQTWHVEEPGPVTQVLEGPVLDPIPVVVRLSVTADA